LVSGNPGDFLGSMEELSLYLGANPTSDVRRIYEVVAIGVQNSFFCKAKKPGKNGDARKSWISGTT